MQSCQWVRSPYPTIAGWRFSWRQRTFSDGASWNERTPSRTDAAPEQSISSNAGGSAFGCRSTRTAWLSGAVLIVIAGSSRLNGPSQGDASDVQKYHCVSAVRYGCLRMAAVLSMFLSQVHRGNGSDPSPGRPRDQLGQPGRMPGLLRDHRYREAPRASQHRAEVRPDAENRW